MGYDIRASSAGCTRNTFGEIDFESIILCLRCNSISGVVRDSGLNKLCRQILASLIILFQGCIATNEALWPTNIPQREYFESIYSGDKDNQLVQSKAGYLQWVVSFYEGTLIAPVGWLGLQSTVLDKADPKDRLELGNRLTTVGRLISGEWAKENDKRVIGCGVKNSTSGLLMGSCDEFLYYDDLAKAADVKAGKRAEKTKQVPKSAKKKAAKTKAASKEGAAVAETDQDGDAIDLMLEIVENLSKDYDAVWGSMIKQALRRVHPDFNEVSAGYRNFADLLQEAEREGCVRLEYDERRGNYRVDLADE